MSGSKVRSAPAHRDQIVADLVQAADEGLGPYTKKLMRAYNAARLRDTPIPRSFYTNLNQAVKTGELSPEAALQLRAKVVSELSNLTGAVRAELAAINIAVEGQPRGAHRWSGKLRCNTALSLYTFDTNPEAPFFDVEPLFKLVNEQLMQSGHAWETPENFPKLINPAYRPNTGIPEILDFSTASRIRLWHIGFKQYCAFFKTQPEAVQAQLRQVDDHLTVSSVQEWDNAYSESLWGKIQRHTKSVISFFNFGMQNRVILMIIKNVICTLFVCVFLKSMVAPVLFPFLVELLLGHALSTIVRVLGESLGMVEISSSLNPLLVFGSFFWKVLKEFTPTKLPSAAAETGLWAKFGSSWVLAATEGLRKLVGFETLTGKWLDVIDQIYSLLGTLLGRDSGSISGLLTVIILQNPSFICRLFGLYSEGAEANCRVIADWVAYVINASSFVWLIWTIVAEIAVLWELYRNPKMLNLEALEKGRYHERSFCIGSLVEVLHLHRPAPFTEPKRNPETNRTENTKNQEKEDEAYERVLYGPEPNSDENPNVWPKAEQPKSKRTDTVPTVENIMRTSGFDSIGDALDTLRQFGNATYCARSEADIRNDLIIAMKRDPLVAIFNLFGDELAIRLGMEKEVQRKACAITRNGTLLDRILAAYGSKK